MTSASGRRRAELRLESAATQVRNLGTLVDPRLVWLCAVLIGVDLFFVAVHAVHTIYASLYTDRIPVLDWRWDIANDRSYLEFVGYGKMLLVVGLLATLPANKERSVYLSFAVLFIFALLDDSLMMHETLGQPIADALALRPSAGLRPADLGELVFWVGAGLLLSGVAAIGLVKARGRDRANGLLLLGALATLTMFAVGVDMAHVVVEHAFRGSGLLFTVIEEGGQQIILSLSCGLAVLIRREIRSRERPLLRRRGLPISGQIPY